jgi:hypothetical protein
VADRPRRSSPRQAALQHAAYLPPAYELADVTALQALERGEATPDQQKRALRWIIGGACGTYDLAYRPGGEDGARDTLIALGRQFVGQQIVKLLRLVPHVLRKSEPRADTSKEQP